MPHRAPIRTGRPPKAVTGLVAAALVVVALVVGTAPAAQAADQHTGDVGDTLRVVHANIRNGMEHVRFLEDIKKVGYLRPDVATLNEVAGRSDADLTPPGYAAFRTPGTYDGANVVIWRDDRWSLSRSGTVTIGSPVGICCGQRHDPGIRRATWVVLKSVAGRQLAVVSTHFAQKAENTVGTKPQEVTDLGELTSQLRKYGPVVVGGDLNMHYRGDRYEPELLAKYNLVPTFDTLGTRFPTHDGGGVIDYILLRQQYELRVDEHFTTELQSDHKAVTADIRFMRSTAAAGWTPSRAVYRPTVIRNVTDPQRVRQALITSVDRVPPGAAIHLTTPRLADVDLKRALVRAHLRGVYVQLVVHGRYEINPMERRLRVLLGTDTSRRDFAARCRTGCAKVLADHGMDITSLMLSRAGRTPAVRIDSNRATSPAATKPRARAVVTTDLSSYNRAFKGFFRLVA